MIKVGDRFDTSNNDTCIVIEYINNKNIKIQFEDTNKHTAKVTATQLKNGWIKNPYKPLLFGVGYFGVGCHKAKEGSASDGFVRLPAYSAWANMLSRCYDENYITPHLYEDTTIHKDWHCFQTFADWYSNEVRYTGWDDRTCLDKDVVGDGYLYSEDNCCLIPSCINSIISNRQGGKYLTGVRKASDNVYRVIPGYLCSGDRFGDEKAAHMAFVEAKSEKIKQLANEYQKFLRPDVYETLIKKDFRYKFSPFFQKEKSLQSLSK